MFYSVDLRSGPQSSISNKFSGDADATSAVATLWEPFTKPPEWQLFTLSLPTSKHYTSLFQKRQWPRNCLMPVVIIMYNWAKFQFQEPPQISTISKLQNREQQRKFSFPRVFSFLAFLYILFSTTRNHFYMMISQCECYGKHSFRFFIYL